MVQGHPYSSNAGIISISPLAKSKNSTLDEGTLFLLSVNWKLFIIISFLVVLVVLTILGNLLVIVAVVGEAHLRANLTNSFIVSLAAADLLMGSIVMPFAVFEQITFLQSKSQILTESSSVSWPFGQLWCDFWHAFDVLSSTASILNLCAISLDRYWATSNPFLYPLRMTPRLSGLMIAAVWCCSAVISFPAIAWWRAAGRFNNATSSTDPTRDECLFPTDQLYLFLSSCISFYLPLMVMIFVYWRIYQVASSLVRSLSQGQKVIGRKTEGGKVMVLGVHRGGGTHSEACASTTWDAPTDPRPALRSSMRLRKVDRPCDQPPECSPPWGRSGGKLNVRFSSNTSAERKQGCSTDRVNSLKRLIQMTKRPTGIQMQICCKDTLGCCLKRDRHHFECNNISEYSHSKDRTKEPQSLTKNVPTNENSGPSIRLFTWSRFGRRFGKFVHEQKAAKTLGIVMGIFIICWLPFFICNTAKAVSPEVLGIHDAYIMSIVTWLGYMNSGVNPLIYAHSMREFRRAFIRVLCFGRRHGFSKGSTRKNMFLQLVNSSIHSDYSVNCRRRHTKKLQKRSPENSDETCKALPITPKEHHMCSKPYLSDKLECIYPISGSKSAESDCSYSTSSIPSCQYVQKIKRQTKMKIPRILKPFRDKKSIFLWSKYTENKHCMNEWFYETRSSPVACISARKWSLVNSQELSANKFGDKVLNDINDYTEPTGLENHKSETKYERCNNTSIKLETLNRDGHNKLIKKTDETLSTSSFGQKYSPCTDLNEISDTFEQAEKFLSFTNDTTLYTKIPAFLAKPTEFYFRSPLKSSIHEANIISPKVEF
ncbi:unnamed protein product [Protopolystoma xenopodis]|uniref:G-protein coupled receptors family 1 profile domain-containing protein n=1 Tax=Protopolystoma xenopodis TaxID=117903 RepID=A0A3S5AUP5_9PLAT|nr:unnamed protein product [Protopolystoma xenopodis]